jgi:hypothetical protein
MSNGFLRYKGYSGTVCQDDQGWNGKLIRKPNGEAMFDLWLYEADNYEALKPAFAEAVDSYEKSLAL